MSSKRLIFFDTETTGTTATIDRIVELAAYDPARNATFSRLIHPQVPIPKEVTAIHGITDEMVAHESDFGVVGRAFLEFCSDNFVLVAHNGDGFDIPFLISEGRRHGLDFTKISSFDTLKWARKYRPDLPKHSLQFLRQVYGIEANRAHRALDDVMVLHQVFSRMTDDLSVDQVLSLIKS